MFAGHGGRCVGHPTVPSCQQTGYFAPQKSRVLGFVLFGSAPALKSPWEELFKVSVCFPAPGTSRTPTQRAKHRSAPSRVHRDPNGAPRHRFPPLCPCHPHVPSSPVRGCGARQAHVRSDNLLRRLSEGLRGLAVGPRHSPTLRALKCTYCLGLGAMGGLKRGAWDPQLPTHPSP